MNNRVNMIIEEMVLAKNKMFVIPSSLRYQWVLDLMKGRVPRKTNEIRKRMLCSQLKFVYKRIDYWRQFDFLKELNYENCDDILKKLPITDKTFIADNENTVVRHGVALRRSIVGFTGGTTGEPFRFYRGWADERVHQCALYSFMTGRDFRKKNNQKHIVSFDGLRPKEEDVANGVFWTNYDQGHFGSVSFCSLYMTDKNLPRYIEKLNAIKPLVIRGYSNAIITMALYILTHGGLTFTPLAIYVTSEKCSKKDMEIISKAFHCPVHGQYGLNEACLFAWTKANSPRYYFSPFYGYVEILDAEGNSTKNGEYGEVVCTSFGNAIQPFIRYRTGDFVRFEGEKNGVLIVSELVGKNNEYLLDQKKNRVYLSGFLDVHYLKSSNRIKKMQIIQRQPGFVKVYVISDQFGDLDKKEIIDLLSKRKIGSEVFVVDKIQYTVNGKQKYVIRTCSE